MLTSLVLDKWEIPTLDACIQKIYQSTHSKQEIADLSILLDDACIAGDEPALSISIKAASALFLCTQTVMQRLGCEDDVSALILQGSVLVKGMYVKNTLVAKLATAYPKLTLQEPKGDAAWGAILFAMEHMLTCKGEGADSSYTGFCHK